MRKVKVTAIAGSLAGLALFASVAGAALIKGTSGDDVRGASVAFVTMVLLLTDPMVSRVRVSGGPSVDPSGTSFGDRRACGEPKGALDLFADDGAGREAAVEDGAADGEPPGARLGQGRIARLDRRCRRR